MRIRSFAAASGSFFGSTLKRRAWQWREKKVGERRSDATVSVGICVLAKQRSMFRSPSKTAVGIAGSPETMLDLVESEGLVPWTRRRALSRDCWLNDRARSRTFARTERIETS